MSEVSAPLVALLRVLAGALERQRWRFLLEEAGLNADEVLDEHGMLPVVLWVADAQHRLVFGRDLGCALEVAPDPSTLCGMRLAHVAPDASVSNAVRLLFMLDAILGPAHPGPGATVDLGGLRTFGAQLAKNPEAVNILRY